MIRAEGRIDSALNRCMQVPSRLQGSGALAVIGPMILGWASAADSTHPVPLPQMRLVLCIDPGHPSENGSGTRGRHITELDAAWAVSKRLQALLEQRGIQVVLTKNHAHQRVTNRERANMANRVGAALMLRIHCDDGQESGFATYYPGRQGTVNGFRGPSADVIRRSKEGAIAFHPAVIHALAGAVADRGLKTDLQTKFGRRQGALTGSIFSRVPVILVEMAVLQNAHDDRFISSERGQQRMAEALASGAIAAMKALHE